MRTRASAHPRIQPLPCEFRTLSRAICAPFHGRCSEFRVACGNIAPVGSGRFSTTIPDAFGCTSRHVHRTLSSHHPRKRIGHSYSCDACRGTCRRRPGCTRAPSPSLNDDAKATSELQKIDGWRRTCSPRIRPCTSAASGAFFGARVLRTVGGASTSQCGRLLCSSVPVIRESSPFRSGVREMSRIMRRSRQRSIRAQDVRSEEPGDVASE